MIDKTDTKIIEILQNNARTSNAEIARQVGKTASAVFERIKKLESKGIVKGYSAIVNPDAVDRSLLAYVFIRLSPHRYASAVGAQLVEIEGVQEVIHLTGEECFMVKARCSDTACLERLVLRINDIDTVNSTRTTIAFRSMKESLDLPVKATE